MLNLVTPSLPLSSTCGEWITQKNHCRFAPLRSPEQQKIRTSRLLTQAAALFPLSPPPEQPAASGQQPPNCWGERVLPYLIALDDVIDLPQVAAATCFVADLQQHQAYFLLSQFSCGSSSLPSLLKHTERQTAIERGEDGKESAKKTKYRVRQKERRGNREEGGCQLISEQHLWRTELFLV